MDLRSRRAGPRLGNATRFLAALAGAGALLAASPPRVAEAQGFLDQLGTHDPWNRLERQDAPEREEALVDALRSADRSSCGTLFALYRSEPASTGLRPALLRAFGGLGCRSLRAHLEAQARRATPKVESHAAIAALGRLRAPESLPLLEALARTGQAPGPAVAALRRYGDAAVPGLLRLARLQGPATALATEALAGLRAPAALPLLRDGLATGALPPALALESLGRLGGPAPLPLLLPWLSHPTPGLRRVAMEAVARCADARAVPALMAALADPELRERAARTLANLAAPAPLSPLVSLLPLGSAAPGPPRPATSALVRALGRVGGPSAVEPLTALLTHGPPGLRGEALDALQYTRSPRAVRLLRRLARRGGPHAPRALLRLGSLLRRAAGAGPGQAGPLAREAARAIPELRAYLRGRDPRLQAAALRALGRIGDPTALPLLLAALRGPAPALRRAAAAALGDLDDDGVVAALTRALRKDKDALVRAEAAWALGRQRSHLAAEALFGALEDPQFPVAINAAAALGALGVRPLGGRLTSALGHADSRVRANAARALARLGYGGARARLLRSAQEDRAPRVRAAAVQALVQIHGASVRAALARLRDREADPVVDRALEVALLTLAGRRPPAAPGRPGPWIDVRVETGSGAAVAWRAYLLRLPDGTVVGGATDADGHGLLEGTPPGEASLELLSFSLPPRPAPPGGAAHRRP